MNAFANKRLADLDASICASPEATARRRIALVVACWMIAWTGVSGQRSVAEDNKELLYESDVRLILRAHCWHCHGEEPEVAGTLDLRLVRTMLQGGDSGPALTIGDADHSLLWQRIESGEMPPKGKGLSDAEKLTLKAWINQGAKTARPEPASVSELSEWNEEDQRYWAFQPLKRPALPTWTSSDLDLASQASNAIDLFLLAELQKHGLGYSPQADRATLLRRLCLDLTGLPPTPAMVDAFIADESPNAYEECVERLLASSQYGERWGRHWLDAAGYADSDGYTENDSLRPWAFRYRDYVIRALNKDIPLDQFVVEQLAGDELVPPPHENLTSEQVDKLAATGFLRMAPDGTGESGVDENIAKNDVISETIKIVSTSMLGMTVGCAQCHNHRYDPISQKDYYRFRAIFEPALDWKNWRPKGSRLVSLWQEAEKKQAALVDAELAEIESHRIMDLDCLIHQVFHRELEKVPAERRELGRLARETPADKRTEEQKAILKEFPSLNVDRGSVYLYEQAAVDALNKQHEEQANQVRARRPAESYVACLSEVPGQVPPTYVFFRGDLNQPRETVEPGDLSILANRSQMAADDEQLPTTGRRLGLARYWTSGQNPLLPRAMVNRMWLHHFGQGIVATPGDFGRLGEKPSHPELLDWLACELVDSGWQLKRLHRLLVTSQAYRQTTTRTEALQQIDPENKLLGRMSIRRLEAESIRDAMIEMTGLQNSWMYGPAVAVNPDESGQAIIGTATRDGNGILVAQFQDGPDQYRRSVYLQVRRTLPFGMLEPFDMASVSPNCDRRTSSTVAPQSLLMMNNRYTILYAEKFAERVRREAGEDSVAQIKLAWKLAFGVDASPADVQACQDLVQSQRALFEKTQADAANNDPAVVASRGTQLPVDLQSLAILCQALMSSNRFLYVE